MSLRGIVSFARDVIIRVVINVDSRQMMSGRVEDDGAADTVRAFFASQRSSLWPCNLLVAC